MAFTKVVGAGIHTLSNITSHNINSSGIITATKFVGPFDGTSGTFSGNVTIGGNLSVAQTVTYEDVKNVDSVGIGTFREGIFIPDSKELKIGNTASSPDLKLYSDGTNAIQFAQNNPFYIKGEAVFIQTNNNEAAAYFLKNGGAKLYYDGSALPKFETTSSGVSIGGTTIITSASGGKLGIGTDNPAKQVHIEGAEPFLRLENTHTGSKRLDLRVEDSDNNAYISAAQSGQYLKLYGRSGFTIATDSETDERLRITSAGNLGIGTDNPTRKLHVFDSSATSTTARANTVARFLSNASNADCNIQISNAVDHSAQIGIVGDGAEVYISQDGVERFRIKSDGKVGINSTAPTNMLDVAGTADVLGLYRNDYTGTGGAGLNLNFGGAKANGDLFNCAKISAVRSDNTAQAGEFRFSVLTSGSMSEKLRITSGGQVNIGVTASILSQTTYKLQVETATNKRISFGAAVHDDLGNEGPGIFFSRQSDGSPTIAGIFGHSNTSLGIAARADLTFHAGGTSSYGAAPERLRITSGGSVGIGSQSPGGVLDLYHATSNTILNVKSGDAGSVINLIDNATRSSIEQNGTSLKVISDTVGTYANSDIRLQVDGGTVMMLDHDGYVGINQTSPTAELEVTPKGTATDTATIFINAKTHDTNVASEAILKFGYGHSGSPDGVGHIKMVEDANNSFDADLKIALPVNNGSGGSVTTERMHLDGTYGRLGLNSTSFADTSTALVVRNGRSDSDHTMLDIICNDNETTRIMFSEDSNHGKGQIRYTYTGDNNYMSFYTNGSSTGNERLRIDNQGKLIMGSGGATNDTSERFLVDGSGSSDHCGLGIKTNNNVHDGIIAFHDSDATYRGQIRYDHEHDDMYFTTNGGSERLRIDSGGNIGVGNWGTASIPQALSIKGGVYMQQGNVITWNNGDCDIGGVSGYHLRFRTYTGSSNTEKMRITSKGIIWTPIGPNSHNSTTAAALVNTSGRQVDTSATQFQTSYKQNLSTGWYTIAVSNGGRSFGRMGIAETYSSRHQACMFYAGHHYGGSSDQNSIHAITSGRHSGNPLGALRIKAYGTYDGAMLQVYLRDGNNGLRAFLLGDNMQTHGWIMKDWIADGTDPGDLSNWSNIDTHGGVAAYADLNVIQAGGSATDGHVIPGFDNRSDLGSSSYKWRDVYCNEGAFNNSDEVLKQNILELTTAEMNAAKRISKLFRTYKWKESVVAKGDDARIHTGAIAQQIQAAMSAEGLDAANYGFFGKNEWYEDSEGTQLPSKTATRQGDPVPVDTNAELGGDIVVPAGFNKITRYSVRYTELLAFIAAYNEQRFTSIESRLTALESS